jgi:hypothetical protein
VVVEQLSKNTIANKNKMAKKNKGYAWLIFPLLAFHLYEDGTKEISFGWLTRTWWIKF